jgi:uncharacterized membrane protein
MTLLPFAAGMSGVCIALLVFCAVICHRAATGRLKRNGRVGIRVPSMFGSERAWRAGHRAAGRFTWVWLALTVGVTVTVVRWAGRTAESDAMLFAVAGGVVGWMVVYSVLAGVVGARAARSVQEQEN